MEEPQVEQQNESRWRPTRRQVLWTVGVGLALVVLVTLVVLVRIGYAYRWTGFGQVKVNEAARPAKTLWDWLNLLIIPFVIAVVGTVGGYFFARSENRATLASAERRARDETLQVYLDQMGQMLLDKERPLRQSQEDDEARTLARARTLTVLSRLDGRRKGTVVQFLYESGLIGWVKSLKSMEKYGAVVDLRGADLRGAVLVEAVLIGAELRGVNLSDAELHGAALSSADLRGADLRGANLSGADLGGADLSGLDPVAPTFYPPVDRMRYANLSHADLKGAIMVGVDLAGACLDGADLNRADLVHPRAGGPSEQEHRLAEARGLSLSREVTANLRLEVMAASLKGAIMPNGQKYEDWIERKGRWEDMKNGGSL